MDEIIFRPSSGQLSGYYYHDGWIRTHFWRCERWSCLVALPESLATLIKLWTIMWRAIFFSHSLIEALVECFEKKVHFYSTVHHATLRQYVLIRNVPAICRWFSAFFFGRIFIFSSCTVFTCRCSLLVHDFIFLADIFCACLSVYFREFSLWWKIFASKSRLASIIAVITVIGRHWHIGCSLKTFRFCRVTFFVLQTNFTHCPTWRPITTIGIPRNLVTRLRNGKQIPTHCIFPFRHPQELHSNRSFAA